MSARASAAAAPAWATVSGMSCGPWQAPAMKIPSVKVFTGASLGWRSRKKPSVEQEMLNRRRTSWASALRLQADGQDHHVHGDAAHDADQGVLHPDDQLALLLRAGMAQSVTSATRPG